MKEMTLDPFVAVELQNLALPDGTPSNRHAVVLDPEGEKYQAGIVSSDYALVTNQEAVQVGYDILEQTGFDFQKHKTIWNGKKFRERFLIESLAGEIRVGDVVACCFDIQNSYDGSTKLAIELNLLRLACSNGMQVSEHLFSYRFKHFGDKDFQEEVQIASQQVNGIQDRLHAVLPMLSDLTRKRVKRADIQKFFKHTKMPAKTAMKVFEGIEEDTQFGLMDATTGVLTKQNNFIAENMNRKVMKYFLSPN